MNSPEKKEPGRRWRESAIPQHGIGFLLAMILLSVAFHLASYVNVTRFVGHSSVPRLQIAKQPPVKVRLVTKEPKKKKDDAPEVKEKKILETPLLQTEAPEDPRYNGAQNHKTLKETKLAKQNERPKAADAGQGAAKKTQRQVVQSQPPPPDKPDLKIRPSDRGTLEVADPLRKPRNKYEALMPTQHELKEQIAAGYQDFVDERLEEGDRIDLNTADYRYIGYFTSMRKAIELVWNYPYDAVRRGLHGEVGLEFVIAKDGHVSKIRVVASSGHPILDDAIVEAIKLASPFSPLPDGFAKDKLLITGSFRYVLTNYAGAY